MDKKNLFDNIFQTSIKKKVMLFSLLIVLVGFYACRLGNKKPEMNSMLKSGSEQNLVVFQNFEDGTGFSAGNSGAVASVVNTKGGGTNRFLRFDVIDTGGPGNDLNCIVIHPHTNQPVDVSDYNIMNFFLKDSYGEDAHTITIIDSKGSQWFGWVDIDTKSDNWRKVSVSIDMAKNDIDLSSVSEIRIGEWSKGVFHIDDISFTVAEKESSTQNKNNIQLSSIVNSEILTKNL